MKSIYIFWKLLISLNYPWSILETSLIFVRQLIKHRIVYYQFPFNRTCCCERFFFVCFNSFDERAEQWMVKSEWIKSMWSNKGNWCQGWARERDTLVPETQAELKNAHIYIPALRLFSAFYCSQFTFTAPRVNKALADGNRASEWERKNVRRSMD